MKTVLFTSALLTTLLCGSAAAQEAGSDAGANAFSTNAALTSDYRYRGISQTRLRPALQGGADFSNAASGLYLGVWASTISWIKDTGGDGNVEIDLYGGRRGEIAPGFGYDVGVLGYVYPSNGLGHVAGFANANTTELYGQLSYKFASLKYSWALGNLFGFVDSRRSGYLDFSANPELADKLVLNLHLGRQRVDNHGEASYTDWKAGLSDDLGVATVSVAYIGTNAGKQVYASPANGAFLGKSALQLTLSKTF